MYDKRKRKKIGKRGKVERAREEIGKERAKLPGRDEKSTTKYYYLIRRHDVDVTGLGVICLYETL